MLVAFVVAIPVAMLLFAAVLTRIEIGLREAQRQELRSQARLLAESGLAVAQSRLASGAMKAGDSWNGEGALDGAGSFSVALAGVGNEESRVAALGTAERGSIRYTCAIEGKVDAEGLQLRGIVCRPIAVESRQ